MRWIREPLVHFLLLGALLFAAYAALQPDAAPEPDARRIELSAGDLHQLEIAFAASWRRTPSPDEMVALVQARIREEVLYREALALGLDKGDTIVKRRLAQKMEFVAEDVSAASEPTRDELQAWFAQNAQRFAVSPRVSFRHLYFSPDRRGAHTRDDAAAAQKQLAGSPEDAPAAAQRGDTFMFQRAFADQSADQVAKHFGPGFAQALFALPPGSWQGPIESGYGWHVVFVDASSPGRVPAYEEVEPQVKAAWKEEQRAEAAKKAYDEMRAKYVVMLPAPENASAEADSTVARAKP
ncbi:MAG: peptidyl-prolyl cis-trans isomerase [Burkholderiaceae bacterium]|nr:peptidyl-prolyl cis-trans isomerase [Burkholderiaceae bacterium]